MPISRMQQPRQLYGLGSLVKSVSKGVKKAVKGVTSAVKKNPELALLALNFAPMLKAGGANTFFGGSKAMFGLPGAAAFKEMGPGGKAATIFAGSSLIGGLLSKAEQEGDPEGITRNVGALKIKLADAYRNQRTFADEEDEEAAIANQVERDVSEYTQDMNRTQFSEGSKDKESKLAERVKELMDDGYEFGEAVKEAMREEKQNYAKGGRIGYAMGDKAEQNAVQAAGIMNLPLNQNPAGVTELDLRKSGGFIPPVGVKEKADDIPAMLSNNEFVFTADAVRGMGDGNVNKGAQRMYDMMKSLENKVV